MNFVLARSCAKIRQGYANSSLDMSAICETFPDLSATTNLYLFVPTYLVISFEIDNSRINYLLAKSYYPGISTEGIHFIYVVLSVR
jgi:hypothetical protein